MGARMTTRLVSKYELSPLAARLESVRQCGRGVIIGYAPDRSRAIIIPTKCRRWPCPKCLPVLLRKWQARISEARPTRLITLTLKPSSKMDLPHRIQWLKARFRLLVDALRKRGKKFEYCYTFELTKGGTPHLHVLQKGNYIAQTELSHLWHRLAGAYIVDIRRIKQPKEAIRYVTKYMLKAPQILVKADFRLRVISASANFFPVVPTTATKTPYSDWVWSWVDSEIYDVIYKAAKHDGFNCLLEIQDTCVMLGHWSYAGLFEHSPPG